jgi:hypothetical protein
MVLFDPNSYQNRVPDRQELKTLRSIASSQSNLAQIIQVQISEAQAAYESAMRRYQAQQLVLDSLLSEVHAAQRYIGILEAQKKVLDDELHDLRGLVHPIRRCPPEILNHIFTMTVTPVPLKSDIKIHREYLRQAYKIVGVCQYWRDVALQCPVLWAAMPVSFNDDIGDIDMFWKRSVERVKRTPASICISDMVPDPIVHTNSWQRQQRCRDALEACDLTQIPVIYKLRLQASRGESVTFPLSLMTRFPKGSLECLEIMGEWDDWTEMPYWWSWNGFLQRFPSPTRLDLEGVQDFTLDKESRFTSVTQLYLFDHQLCPFPDLLLAFPSLEHLDVASLYDSSTTTPNPPSQYPLPHLKTLSVNGVYDFSWGDSITTPNLTKFSFSGEEPEMNSSFATFLSSCPRLTSVELKMSYGSISALARVADGLIHLTLECGEAYLLPLIRWADEGLSTPPFPKLKTLTICYSTPDGGHDPPAFHYFDELVRKRCLSLSDPASLLVHPLVPLELLIIKQNPVITSTWMQSIHYQTATARIVGKDSYFSVVNMSWTLREDEVLTLKPGKY